MGEEGLLHGGPILGVRVRPGRRRVRIYQAALIVQRAWSPCGKPR
ncbi:hypothetical protein FM114_02580 [Luteococcus japonicus LSP_Lj1]|uniref:Uncharacterized protein n=1 Tax=Luteococcus japonicus LSP_Lj1 TaxID=1255658 RepID=A0A1R4ILT6_9ACTN|nr:hypothetical protein FM114_02580 [Luteococcus japonicus LSP_Lj1]